VLTALSLFVTIRDAISVNQFAGCRHNGGVSKETSRIGTMDSLFANRPLQVSSR
jgi:hypothetical protein